MGRMQFPFAFFAGKMLVFEITSADVILCLVSMAAGFIDSIVGGGGLIQAPVLFLLLPNYPAATVLGTGKIPSFSGTALAAYKYSTKVEVQWKLVLNIAFAAFLGSFLGSYYLTLVDNLLFKPIILGVLTVVAIYTYTHKEFGIIEEKNYSIQKEIWIGLMFGFFIGLYDGFIGPGTGTLLILAFISILGKDFLHSSASAKFVNIATNLASIIYLASTGNILFRYAIPMAVFNILGSFFGTRLALLKGNRFIRIFFLLVVFGLILRFAWDVFLK